MKVYAVIDTNVLVSALLAKHTDSAPVQILDRLFSRDFIPMYNEEIIAEYNEVLRRRKFNFSENAIGFAIDALIEAGVESERVASSGEVIDPKDVVFYEVSMSRELLPQTKCWKFSIHSTTSSQSVITSPAPPSVPPLLILS